MRRLQQEVREILRREGVISRRGEPALSGAMTSLVATGELVSVLPGVYLAPTCSADFVHRVKAAMEWDPDLVFTGATAARMTYWRGLPCPVVEAAARWQRASRPGFRFSRRSIPDELVLDRGRARVTDPALTALDLCTVVGGDGIDQALRARATTLDRLRRALELTPGRTGNADRRWLVLDSRDEPWSAAERLCHRLLRGARIAGWKANWPVVSHGSRYYLDVAFPALKVAIEIDGRLHEDDPDVFENDRRRQNDLVLDGWTVLRFTWRMLTDDPETVLSKVRAVTSESSARRPGRTRIALQAPSGA